MKVGSLFSGIGGFDLGFERAGFEIKWQVEIESFCRGVLRERFPRAKKFADVKKVGSNNLSLVDVVCAGVPCQDVSVAGKRAGLTGKRTGLFYEFARVLQELRPAWFVFENVPGFFSSNKGRDFAEVVRVLMVECGYGISWRVLDSRFFGVAQRRRRLFIVGSLGRPCPPQILFERESGEGDFAPSGEAGSDIAYALASRAGGTGSDSSGLGNAWNTTYAIAFESRFARNGRGAPSGIVPPLKAQSGQSGKGDGAPLVAATLNSGGNSGGFRTEPGEHLVSTPSYSDGMRDASRVSEGVDDYPLLPEGKDSPRYRALGNAVTVQVAEWIARRIADFENHKIT